MSRFSLRDATAFNCECGHRYSWISLQRWHTYDGESAPEKTIHDYYLTTSGPVTECTSCGRSLVALA